MAALKKLFILIILNALCLSLYAKTRVIFIHGSPSSSKSFTPVTNNKSLQQGAELETFERPGYQKYNLSSSYQPLETQVQAVLNIINAGDSPSDPVILVGHSYGALIALKAAQSQDPRIKAVVTLAGIFNPEEVQNKWYQNLANLKTVQKILPKALLQSHLEISALKNDLVRSLDSMKQIQVPVYLVHGQADKNVSAENTKFILPYLNRTTTSIVLLPETGHNIMREQPQFVSDLLIDVLKKELANKTKNCSLLFN